MAIEYARAEYISRRKGGNVVRSAAYNASLDLTTSSGRRFTFKRIARTEHSAVMLPPGADERFRDHATLWNVVEHSEKRKDAQLAREIVLALPANRQITQADRIEMVRSFVQEHLVSKGLAVQIDWHVPHSSELGSATANFHAHVLVPTRRLEGDHLSAKKATDLDPTVRHINGVPIVTEGERWGKLWHAWQDAYFSASGLDITVDPVAAAPGKHLGPVRHRLLATSY